MVDPDDTLTGRVKAKSTKWAKEHIKLAIAAFSLTSLLGGAIIAYFGLDIITPGEKLNRHIAQEDTLHEIIIKPKLSEVDSHAHELEGLTIPLVRGECLENPRDQLILQGLWKTCIRLGIDPATKSALSPSEQRSLLGDSL